MDDVALTRLLCELIGGLPGVSWRPDGPDYTDTETAVFYGQIKASPDRAIGVRVYAGTDDRETRLGWRRAQVRFRGAPGRPDGADALADGVFARLQGLSRVEGISDISRLSMAPLGADQNGREERADNYIFILDNPEVVAS